MHWFQKLVVFNFLSRLYMRGTGVPYTSVSCAVGRRITPVNTDLTAPLQLSSFHNSPSSDPAWAAFSGPVSRPGHIKLHGLQGERSIVYHHVLGSANPP